MLVVVVVILGWCNYGVNIGFCGNAITFHVPNVCGKCREKENCISY